MHRDGWTRHVRDSRMIGLRRLRYFAAAAEESNFRRAALRLNTNQSVISKHVRDIEEELGAGLFRREPGHGAQLTEVGRTFLRDVRAMFDDLDCAKNDGAGGRQWPSRPVAAGGVGRRDNQHASGHHCGISGAMARGTF